MEGHTYTLILVHYLQSKEMPVNALTTDIGLRVGPLVLETLIAHYFERLKRDSDKDKTRLRQDELLYDQVFNVVKVRGRRFRPEVI